jgi:hypothetical protein
VPRYLLILDTPGIKQFVFGTDALAEIRGASALLDRLNRHETQRLLRDELTRPSRGANGLHCIFANGGAAQFIVDAPDEQTVQHAIDALHRHYREQTGGEVRPIVAVQPWPDDLSYRDASRAAFHRLQAQRNWAAGYATVPTFPLVLECESTSHLPAEGPFCWGGETRVISRACRLKYQETAARVGAGQCAVWHDWLHWLDQRDSAEDRAKLQDHAGDLRCHGAEELGEQSSKRGYVALVYADGNAMGRLVQELDDPGVCSQFSQLVDDGLRQACFEALAQACRPSINGAREVLRGGGSPEPLPADILLLGGDDLLVLLPADKALDFALKLGEQFQSLTKQQIAGGGANGSLSPQTREFFAQRGLHDRGLTISCGIALARARYPFYLLLDLAEELLKSAKQGGTAHPERSHYWAPSYIDFHLVSGSMALELAALRHDDYQVATAHRRTLRPCSVETLKRLLDAARQLAKANIARSKLHDFFEAALEPRHTLAQLRAEELFGRLRQSAQRPEREVFWQALQSIGPMTPYPWVDLSARQGAASSDKVRGTALADLIEVHDLIADRNTSSEPT